MAQVAANEAEQARAWAEGMALRAQVMSAWHDNGTVEDLLAPEGHEIVELAGTARIGQGRASSQLSDAQRLTQVWQRTHAAALAGLVYRPSVELMLQLTRNCTPEVQATVEARVFSRAITMNTRDLRRLVLATIPEVEAEVEPEAAAEREDAARDARRTWVNECPDGMAEVTAYLDAIAAKRWQLDFTELVRAETLVDRVEGRERTTAQRQADVFAELPSRVIALIRALHAGDVAALQEIAALTPGQVAELRTLVQETSTGTAPATEQEPEAVDEDPGDVPDDAALTCHDEFTAAFLGGLAIVSGWDVTRLHTELYGTTSLLDPPKEPPDWDGWLRELMHDDPPDPEPPPPPPPSPHDDDSTDWRDLAVAALRLTPAAPVSVVVHVPLSTALDLDQRSGRIDGTAPGGASLPARRCRLLLPDAALQRLVTTERGIPLQLDPAVPAAGERTRERLLDMITAVVVEELAQPQHDPSGRLRRTVELRDQHCTGIGCSVPARRCDLDHAQRWPEGETAGWNLFARSDRCHHLKHDGWDVSHDEVTGTTTWTSPDGNRYTSQSSWARPTTGLDLALLVDAYLATRSPGPDSTGAEADGTCARQPSAVRGLRTHVPSPHEL